MLAPVHAADLRVWTSRKGTTLEAELLKVDGESATLVDKDAKQIVLKVEDLSLADRQFLVEYGEADPKILVSGELGAPEKQVRIDSKSFKKIKDRTLMLGAGKDSEFDLLESDHFLIASAGKVRPQAVAETAERMWHGMAFQHMNFRRDWGDKRMMIVLVEDRDAYTALGKWYKAHLLDIGQDDAAKQVGLMWEKTGSSSMSLPDTMVEKNNVFPTARLFNIKEASLFKKPMSPFQIHTIGGALLSKQMGGVSSFGAEGFFAVLTGHSYFKEISLAGKSETQLLDLTGTSKDEFSEAKGFEDGSSWAKTLKPLVRKGTVKTKLEPMFGWKVENLTPERLVLVYSFGCYMQSTPRRLNSFAAMVRRIESSNQIPALIEIARLFGFETVEELEEDWALFIKEGDFK